MPLDGLNIFSYLPCPTRLTVSSCFSVIREAVVSILSSPFHVDGDGRIQPRGIAAASRADCVGLAGALSPGGRTERLGPISVPTCMFWCAVAAGGVLQGQPMTSVGGADHPFRFARNWCWCLGDGVLFSRECAREVPVVGD